MGSIAKGTVCVTGAAGYIGSWLVKRLLELGYVVRATVRNPGDENKVKCLLDLPYASTNLTIWKGDLTVDGSFDEAIQGCEGVFHVATPMDFESQDPENEMIKPTVEGVLSIIRSCVKAKTVQRLVYTSSAGTVNVEEHQQPLYDETNWSDLDFIRSKKMTGWMYFVSKLLAEKEAWKAAKENNIDFISIIPTLVVGPFIVPSFPPSLKTALSLITGDEAHYSIIKQGQYVHLDDLCESHIFLYEDPTAEGRYICSSHNATIHELAEIIREKWPEYHIPELKGIDKDIPVVSFSSKKLIGMGFQYKYTLEDMFKGAIESCRLRGLIPRSTQYQANGKDNDLKELIRRSTHIQANGKVNDLSGEGLIARSTQFQANGKENDLKGLFQHSTHIYVNGEKNDLVFTEIKDKAKSTENGIASQI